MVTLFFIERTYLGSVAMNHCSLNHNWTRRIPWHSHVTFSFILFDMLNADT